MTAAYKENQATFRHAIVATMMVEESLGSDRRVPQRFYFGPFADRRTAESWASVQYEENSDVS